ncbi:MAG: 50S ribosomal protein L35 [Candidatus Nealsonbacteria bacterium]|nr:50S ribosomal protein L35 [Candidatus Nealsonbacteria bacterium]
MKTRKSIKKRFKVTKSGKLLRRKTQLDHYLAKKSGKQTRKSRKMQKLSKSEIKQVKRLLGI